MSKNPRYWDSWKGQILRAIIIDKLDTWIEVRDKAELTQRKMFKVVGELRRVGVLEYSKNDGFKILDDDLRKAYENTSVQSSSAPEPSQEHIDWLRSWIDSNERVETTLENQHFFLDGPDLYEFTRKLIGQAKKSIYVVNPFVDKAGLGTAIRTTAKNGVAVSIITRRPVSNPARWKFHKTLLDANINLFYSGEENSAGGVHSKLLVVDGEIAVVSSMNFTSHSESYNYETGIVTIDKSSVESANESIIGIRDEPETFHASEVH